MKKILLIADSCKDVYHIGNVTRISPEAPVPVFETNYHIINEGMGGNVYNNLLKLELKVTCIFPKLPSFKHRYIDKTSKQQIIRIDESIKHETLNILNVYRMLDNCEYDAVIVSDYDKGFISLENLKKISVYCIMSGIDLFVDSKKKEIFELSNCFIKINEKEYNIAKEYKKPDESIKLIVTYGENGAYLNNKHFQQNNKVEVRDVTGAGDTFLSAFVFQYLYSKSLDDAMIFANKASSITVQKFGTYAPSIQEINRV